MSCNDINPYRFDWWCFNCEMAIRDQHVTDGTCPNCGEEVIDMDDMIDVWEEYNNSPGNGLTEDDEGNVIYGGDDWR